MAVTTAVFRSGDRVRVLMTIPFSSPSDRLSSPVFASQSLMVLLGTRTLCGFWPLGSVTSLAFSPDGKLLAAGCADGKVRLFDGRTGELKKVWDDDSARAMWIVFSPDGKTLVSQSSDKTVKVWDAETAKVLRTLQGNKAWVVAVAFSPDGKLFATGGIVRENDRRLACWRWQKGRSRRG